MKKILLITSLLIVFGFGCSNNETEERIAMLEHRIEQLEVDLLCDDKKDQTEYRLQSNYRSKAYYYCSEREEFLIEKINNGMVAKHNNYGIELMNVQTMVGVDQMEFQEFNKNHFEAIFEEFYIEK